MYFALMNSFVNIDFLGKVLMVKQIDNAAWLKMYAGAFTHPTTLCTSTPMP